MKTNTPPTAWAERVQSMTDAEQEAAAEDLSKAIASTRRELRDLEERQAELNSEITKREFAGGAKKLAQHRLIKSRAKGTP